MSGTCFECKFMRQRTDLEPCEHCTNVFAMTGVHPSFQPRKLQTNADRIRAMSDEELAEWVWGAETAGRAYGPRGKQSWLNWLKQEADNGRDA